MLRVHLQIGFVLCCYVVQAQETAATRNTSSIYGRVTKSNSNIPLRQQRVVQVAAKYFGANDESREVPTAADSVLALRTAALAFGQDPAKPQEPTKPTTTTITQTPTTVTKTVQHPDGTFTVIEYPVKKEVKVMLNPVALTGSTGVATVLRDDDGTRIVLNLSAVPAQVTTVNFYAVDETGAITSLGPVAITGGTGTLTITMPLTKFMLIGSPETTLTTYDPNTKVFFRSAVPEGFAVIPHTATPVGEKVAATTTDLPEFPWPPQASAYTKIPSQYFLKPQGKTLLKEVGERLETAFHSAGYKQTGYYSVPGGFALASQLEQFKPDGLPADDPYRWTEQVQVPSFFSREYLGALIRGKIGRYRVIVFAVSDDYFSQSQGKKVEIDQAEMLAIRGASALPAGVGDLPYTPKHTCTALVYEFEKALLDKPAQFKDNSTLLAESHLQKILPFLLR